MRKYQSMQTGTRRLFLAAAMLCILAGGMERAGAEPIKIVAFGDSNTAGFRVRNENAYPAQLEHLLRGEIGCKISRKITPHRLCECVGVILHGVVHVDGSAIGHLL